MLPILIMTRIKSKVFSFERLKKKMGVKKREIEFKKAFVQNIRVKKKLTQEPT